MGGSGNLGSPVITNFIKKMISCHRIDGLARIKAEKDSPERPSGSQEQQPMFVVTVVGYSHGKAPLGWCCVDTLALVLPRQFAPSRENHRIVEWVVLEGTLKIISFKPCSKAAQGHSRSSPCLSFPSGK